MSILLYRVGLGFTFVAYGTTLLRFDSGLPAATKSSIIFVAVSKRKKRENPCVESSF